MPGAQDNKATRPTLASQVSPYSKSSPRNDPLEDHGTVPRHFPLGVPQTRFRWWRWMNEAHKSCLSVIMTRGWVFKCVGLLLEVF